jgi:hypothetical protein
MAIVWKERPMCDYSLHNVASRPAKIADELVVTKFPNSITTGFAAVGEPGVAVCLLPGTELVFEQDAETYHPFARLFPKFGFGRIGEKVARFRQVDMDCGNVHHDALEFPNGRIVLVTKLRAGQRARVLQLPATSAGLQPSEHLQPSVHAETLPDRDEARLNLPEMPS